ALRRTHADPGLHPRRGACRAAASGRRETDRHGPRARGRGVGAYPPQTTEVFLHFKSHVTEMLATPPRGGFGQIRSLRETDAFLGEVLQAMMEAGDAARTRLEPRG